MDLVDIDQVLDNLELREAADEHRTSSSSHLARRSLAGARNVAVSNGSPSHANANTSAQSSPSSNSNSTANSCSKSFVGVSQVFNSLDDYRKNVETLESASMRRYDDECKLIANTEAPEDPLPQSPITVPVSVEPVVRSVEQPPPESTNEQASALQEEKYADDDYGSDDDDDLTNDIEKYRDDGASKRGRHGENNVEDSTTTSTSDSLTTSSPSTFSSGPSPGFMSTTEEQSTPLSGVVDGEEAKDGVDASLQAGQDGTSAQVAQTRMNALAAASVSEISSQEENFHASDQLKNKRAGLDELAAGLSSISINSQSDLPREITVSSALGGLLNELTTSSQSQLKVSECLPSHAGREEGSKSAGTTPLSLLDNESMKKQEEDLQCDAKAADKRGAAVYPCQASNEPPAPIFQQPITFGSTMDEISDTELDSMLQEMDIDDAEEVHKDSICANTSAKAVALAARDRRLDVGDMEEAASIADQMNADSFSQASTVEFSEIRAQQPPQMVSDEFDQSLNSSSESSYSSSESSLDEAAQLGGDYDADAADNSRRPTRPTTLDLPVMKMNLYANAGQTPPGNSLTQSDFEPDSSEELVSPQEPNEVVAEYLQPQTAGDGSAGGDSAKEDEKSTEESGPQDIGANGEGEVAADAGAEIAEAVGYTDPHVNLGKIPPIWVPDNMATSCMQCHVKFTMIKRRHHCRACGKVLCSVCCSQKFKLDFLSNPESRVCVQCFLILTQRQQTKESAIGGEAGAVSGLEHPADVEAVSDVVTTPIRSPNPNNPMEYCSTIPPHRQVSSTVAGNPPSVIVPVGVLKKDGSNSSNSSNSSKKGRKRKSVMFSDGIAPGSDLACMENQWSEAKHARRQQQNEKPRGHKSQAVTARTKPVSETNAMGLVAQLFRGSIPPAAAAAAIAATQTVSSISKPGGEIEEVSSKTMTTPRSAQTPTRARRLPPSGCDENGCFIPQGEHCLPPISVTKGENSCDFDYKDVSNDFDLVQRLQRETLKFAIQKNFFVYVKIVNLKCCMNRTVINFTTFGMHQVGNDEIIILLEYELPANKSALAEPPLPKDIFVHLNEIYVEAEKCNPITELSFTMPQHSTFLGSRELGGFLYIRASFQCLQDVVVPENPFLIGVLIHRSEVPWAKVFPLRLMLRLGAQYRYYPCPHISVRNRESVYAEIAQTIMNFLADFRNYSYTLPSIKGMYIHMEDRQTSVLIPRNRHEDVVKAMNNSSDHVLAFGGNFSKAADGHLVCIQNTKDKSAEMFSYSTQAINIQGQPRKVTGASFFVINESLKSSSGLSGKCSIVEDGLMVQILPAKMEEVRTALRNTEDIDIVCGPLNADEQQTEVVSIKWVENYRDFGMGVKSPIDSMSLEGVSGMRVHASFNYSNANYSMRLTEIYMIKCDDWNNRIHSQDIARISEQIARSTSVALLPFLDLLAANGSIKIGLRVTLHQENVCYEAGSRSTKLPPLYMNALDNHLIPTLHQESTGIEEAIVLELVFYILNV